MNEPEGGGDRKDERGVRHSLLCTTNSAGWRVEIKRDAELSGNSTTVLSYRGEKVVAGKSNNSVTRAREENKEEERRTERQLTKTPQAPGNRQQTVEAERTATHRGNKERDTTPSLDGLKHPEPPE